jgi:hypothetical protein
MKVSEQSALGRSTQLSALLDLLVTMLLARMHLDFAFLTMLEWELGTHKRSAESKKFASLTGTCMWAMAQVRYSMRTQLFSTYRSIGMITELSTQGLWESTRGLVKAKVEDTIFSSHSML